MSLVTITDLHLRYRGPALLEGISCRIAAGERIGLLGRNGAGKTTFLRILCGEVEPDHGDVTFSPGARVSLLPQEVPEDLHGTVRDIVTAAGAGSVDSEHRWRAERAGEQMLSRMDLPGGAEFTTLSAGMKRRVLLARALAEEPDLLLLDEPTNHLDVEAITWLEDFLARWKGTLLFITHDRMFLRRLAGRILEIDRGRLFDWSCDYDTFLARKEAALAAEERQNELFDRKLAEEEAWIRQGIKARRTRNEGRVRALEELRRVRSQRRTDAGRVQLAIQEGRRSGTLVAEVDSISFAYGDRVIVRDFSTAVMRGDKIGILGPNGAGKTTLLRLLLGKLPPQAGHVRLGSNLEIAYFDQLRQQLNEEATVQENVGDGYDSVGVGGAARHVIGYLQDFLFTPERARSPVKFLSGGERNRVLLAKLFAKPANVIVLDEPTNDLDSETLEMLEERLVQFQGTVLLVSHDRAFLNNVVTSTIAFEPQGAKEYVGGYDDWLRQRPEPAKPPPAKTPPAKTQPPSNAPREPRETAESAPPPRRRLTFKERRELESLPEAIEALEAEIESLHAAMAQPDFYQQPGEELARQQARLKDLEANLAAAYARWETLESIEG